MRIEIETSIAAPPETVFAVISDIARWPEFIKGIESVEILTPGPVGVGTRFRETRTMYGRKATEEMTVVGVEAPHFFDLTAENHGARYLASHEIVPIHGGSRLVMRFGADPVTLTARIFSVIGALFVTGVKKQLQRDLDDVKAEAERRASR